ncbi:MAG TPA: metallophosphoesterase [Acidimicrobiia bacterium]|nr:metallophosphoesterase [Acidimicrobiia bacterium]
MSGRSNVSADTGPGGFLFRFAVLADTHMNPRDGESPSPWLTNRAANARTRAVVREINRLQPAFTIHLGDIVHPVPSQDTYARAADRAHRVMSALEAPLHYVPGNHDMGDKPVDWAPAAVVNDEFLDAYARHFGTDHSTFDHEGCRFFVLNSQVLNTGSTREAEQWDWLETELETGTGLRTFLFTHYPLYVAEADEMEHYDNIGEPARSRLLDLVERRGVEGVFAGHVHNFFYDRRGGCDFYVLPAVSAVRHDYSELFTTPPAADQEHGRDDSAKLGFFVVDVHERDHIAHFVRSNGATLDEAAGTPSHRMRPPGPHSRTRVDCPVGVDMRQGWGRILEIPYQGVVDEFYRKRARNDYLLAALWEMGIRNLRVPIGDLVDDEVRARMQVLHELGHRFVAFTYEIPTGKAARAILQHGSLLSGIEVILPGRRLTEAAGELGELRRTAGVPVHLSRLRSSAEARADGAAYTHFISHGFDVEDPSEFDVSAVDAVVMRAAAGDLVDEVVSRAVAWASERGTRAVVYVSLADEDPAIVADDEPATARRVAAALFAGHAVGCSIHLDTIADMDRGYFPRLGLVDRRFNPRAAGHVFGTLQGAMAPAGPFTGLRVAGSAGGSRVLTTTAAHGPISLILPSGSEATFPVAGTRVLDLESGLEVEIADRASVTLAHAPVWPLLVT